MPLTAAQTAELHRAHADLTSGQAAAAVGRLQALIAGIGDEPNALQLLGGALKAIGDLAAAHDALVRAVSVAPNSAPLRNSLANLLGDMGSSEAAIAEYMTATALDPSYLDAWLNGGAALSAAARHDEALAWVDQALTIAPRSARALSAQGDALQAASENERAIVAYRSALQIEPARMPTSHNLAMLYRTHDRHADALAILEGGAPGADRDVARAATLADLGRVDEAADAYDRIAEQWPARFDAHRLRAQLIVEHALDVDPYAAFASVARRFPGETSAWHAWAEILVGHRRYAEARAVVAEAGRHGHLDDQLLMLDAVAAGETGDHDSAGAGFRARVARSPDDAVARSALAGHLLRLHDFGGAAHEAEIATRLTPLDQGAWALLGTAWRGLGDDREFWLHDYDRFVGAIEVEGVNGEDATTLAALAAEAIRPLHVARYNPADQTLRGGTQTSGALFDRPIPAVRALAEALARAVRCYVADLPDDPKHPFLGRKGNGIRFSGSWSVRLSASGFHVNHIHPQGWISSAYYMVLPENVAAIEPEGWIQFGAPQENLGLDLPPRRLVRPRAGLLTLFPSSMWHGTIAFGGGGERLTTAFDVIPLI